MGEEGGIREEGMLGILATGDRWPVRELAVARFLCKSRGELEVLAGLAVLAV
jgi:hypothetical protein